MCKKNSRTIFEMFSILLAKHNLVMMILNYKDFLLGI